MSNMQEFLPKAFPVDLGILKESNFEKPATNAQEYLSRVRYEAKQCPDVVVADVQTKPKSITPLLEIEDQVVSTLPWSIPSRKWQQDQSTDYADIRSKLARYQKNSRKEIKEKCPTLPKLRDELGWCKFCLGVEFHDKLVSAINAAGEELPPVIPDDDESRSGLPKDGSPRPPLVSILLCMDQPMVQQVLDYHIHWLKLMGFTIAQGCWLYALMACLAKPLYPDSAASIRVMARLCKTIRLTLESEDDDKLPSLNLLIALVANFFDQGDLMDKA
ncbi:Gem-associated protein 2 [Holothuria leucospilota]|uniref:Gem-associated protein 2 n=1 Tax=Holothuria leucospilota TaxID=206669 RepID=A0A9Q1CJ67_HOLLE|nr:Gem-associated protein 2 [Holothuria leucospilota]